jgi:hypothetical protein
MTYAAAVMTDQEGNEFLALDVHEQMTHVQVFIGYKDLMGSGDKNITEITKMLREAYKEMKRKRQVMPLKLPEVSNNGVRPEEGRVELRESTAGEEGPPEAALEAPGH